MMSDPSRITVTAGAPGATAAGPLVPSVAPPGAGGSGFVPSAAGASIWLSICSAVVPAGRVAGAAAGFVVCAEAVEKVARKRIRARADNTDRIGATPRPITTLHASGPTLVRILSARPRATIDGCPGNRLTT